MNILTRAQYNRVIELLEQFQRSKADVKSFYVDDILIRIGALGGIGVYDDYGRFILENSPENIENLLYFFCELDDKSHKTIQGENQYHDHAFDFEKLLEKHKSDGKSDGMDSIQKIWHDLWEVASENRLFINTYLQEPRQLSFAVMHHLTAEYLIRSVEKTSSWEGQSLEQRSFFKDFINKGTNRALEFKSKYLNEPGQENKFYISYDKFPIGNNEGSYVSLYYSGFDTEPVIEFLSYLLRPFGVVEVPEHIIDIMFAQTKTLLDHQYIMCGMDYLNLKFQPMVYAGQDYSNEIGKNYTDMVVAVNAAINKEIGEDDE